MCFINKINLNTRKKKTTDRANEQKIEHLVGLGKYSEEFKTMELAY